jgi:hypothetical protein
MRFVDDDPRTTSPVRVELQYLEGCPNWRVAAGHLRALATELGFELDYRLVTDSYDAEAVGFRGSPTVLVDGRDPFGSDGALVGLSCRIYSTPDGPAGSPTVEQLRRELRR